MISIRLFVAVELPEKLRAEIAGLNSYFSRANLKPVRKENIHLTLKFLGEVKENRVEDVLQALEKPAGKIRPFSIQPGAPGAFPAPHRARVLWVGLAEVSEPLIDLQREVDQALTELGFEREKKPFSPHITFARLRKPADVSGVLEKASRGFNYRDKVNVESYTLFQSILHPDGPEYIVVKKFDLK